MGGVQQLSDRKQGCASKELVTTIEFGKEFFVRRRKAKTS